MRASAVRAAIIAAVLAATSDSKAGAADKLRCYKGAVEPDATQDRVFTVRLIAGPMKDDSNTCDAFVATYQVSVFHAAAGDIDDRIAAENERIERALRSSALIADEADIMDAQLGNPSVEESASQLVSRRDVTVLYRLDAAVL